jgi:hypothetical protein
MDDMLMGKIDQHSYLSQLSKCIISCLLSPPPLSPPSPSLHSFLYTFAKANQVQLRLAPGKKYY